MLRSLDQGYPECKSLQADGFQPCTCDECRKLFGTADWGQKLWLLNKTWAERLWKDRPGRFLVVTAYTDDALGRMRQEGLGGAFTEVVLRPVVTVADATMVDRARAAHADAFTHCFIANSVNFPVRHEPKILVA